MPPSTPISRRRVIAAVLESVAVKPITTLMITGPTSRKARYSLNRRAKLRGRSTRQTKLKLLSTFCAIINSENSSSATPMLPSSEPLTLSTKPMICAVSSSARGPSGARKPCRSGCKVAVDTEAFQHGER